MTVLRILLIKPFRPSLATVCQPPLGLLYLAAAVREVWPGAEVELLDMRLTEAAPDSLSAHVRQDAYDLVGISALNFEAEAAHELARVAKVLWPKAILAIGGPYAHSSPRRILASADFDWVFDGEAERTLVSAIRAHFFGEGRLGAVPGLTWRSTDTGDYVANGGYDSLPDLDAVAMPAWDLVDFDHYARRPNQNGWLKGTRYAPILTSRGCPYKCSYCHDIFGKKFRWRSPESVLEEIRMLVERFGVDEFQIIDDIYNLHKPRMRRIAELVISTFGERRLNFCFPNGVRADILDPADIPLLARMGVFQIAVAVETVTPRLQKLIQKNLKIERIREVVEACDRAGILSKGFFMLGFPTETLAEIEATIEYAVSSRLTWAGFYLVIPQENTPLHELAKSVAPVALEHVTLRDYYSDVPWYQHAYGIDLRKIQRRAFRRFYLRPRRVWRIISAVGTESLVKGLAIFVKIATIRDPILHRRGAPLRWWRSVRSSSGATA